MSNLKRDGVLRWAPSYLRRQGQMTKAQRRHYRELWPLYGLTFCHGKLLEIGEEPVAMEIGFGMGEHLLERAAAEPGVSFVGIEVHKPALAHTLEQIHSRGLANVRLIRGDARLVLADHLIGRPLRSLHLLFPDPWPKACDAHRRFVQPELVNLLEDRLELGGIFQIASDMACYGVHVEEVMKARVGWEEIAIQRRSDRTRYEEKGCAEGREIWERCYRWKGESSMG